MSFMNKISDDKLKVIFDKFYNNIMSNERLSAFFPTKHILMSVIESQTEHFKSIDSKTKSKLRNIHRKIGYEHAGMGVSFSMIMTAGDYLYNLFMTELSKDTEALCSMDNFFVRMRNDFAYGYIQQNIEEFTETLRIMNVISLDTKVIKDYLEWFMMFNSVILNNDEESMTMLDEHKPSLGSVIIEKNDHLKKLDKLSKKFDMQKEGLLFTINKNNFRSALASYTELKETFLALMYIVSISERAEMAKSFATDSLTKALTRKQMDSIINKAAAKIAIENKEFTVVIADIDHFKKVNDTYGHKAGDMVLKDFAGILMKYTSEHNASVIRYGGEEFVIVFPDKSGEETAKILEYIRLIIEMTPFNVGDHIIHITSSFGVYGCGSGCRDNPDPTELIKLADEKLYRAKAEGRNRIIL